MSFFSDYSPVSIFTLDLIEDTSLLIEWIRSQTEISHCLIYQS